ncbi:MAG: acetolactate synthase small subunit [Lachnospiraceae bacterium]|nr:acetolactate synthase small subunit [Candidatus Equihabitans merdae]
MHSDQIVISVMMDNVPGVLSRIAGLFSRRAYNIESITAGVTKNPKITRMTIVTKGDNHILKQIIAQLSKQVDVRDIKVLEPYESVVRELMLVKIMADNTNRRNLMSIVDIFKAKVVDVQPDCLIIELTGTQLKLEAFLDMLSEYQIAEIARTGLAGLSRGSEGVKYY